MAHSLWLLTPRLLEWTLSPQGSSHGPLGLGDLLLGGLALATVIWCLLPVLVNTCFRLALPLGWEQLGAGSALCSQDQTTPGPDIRAEHRARSP